MWPFYSKFLSFLMSNNNGARFQTHLIVTIERKREMSVCFLTLDLAWNLFVSMLENLLIFQKKRVSSFDVLSGYVSLFCKGESKAINHVYLSSCILTRPCRVYRWFDVVNTRVSKAIGLSDDRSNMTVKIDRWKMINKQ
jgi:hypothetical protein